MHVECMSIVAGGQRYYFQLEPSAQQSLLEYIEQPGDGARKKIQLRQGDPDETTTFVYCDQISTVILGQRIELLERMQMDNIFYQLVTPEIS